MLRTSLIFEFGHALEDEWPCKGPDVKGRARPGPNILKAVSRKGATKNLNAFLCAFCFSFAPLCETSFSPSQLAPLHTFCYIDRSALIRLVGDSDGIPAKHSWADRKYAFGEAKQARARREGASVRQD